MEPTRFDELTKKLASSTSRRQALKAATVAAVGGVLGWRATGTAYASNSACARFCEAVFGENTPAAEQCAADATHGTGLCYTCGPASTGGTKPICCTQTSSGHCTSYSGAACCSSSQTCSNGTCVTPTTTTSTTPAPTTTTSTTAAPTTTTTTTAAPTAWCGQCICNNGTFTVPADLAGSYSDLGTCQNAWAASNPNTKAACTNFCSGNVYGGWSLSSGCGVCP